LQRQSASGEFADSERDTLATVVFVSPNRVVSTGGGESWFVATVALEGAALERHRELRVHPGMPAGMYVKTPERTVLAHLAKSLHIFSNRAMREP
jgi:membrane fusion protein, epimerase transport system